MAEETTKTNDSAETAQGGIAVVAIPPEHLKSVLEYLVKLRGDDDEVAGHMLSGGMIGAGTVLAAKQSDPSLDFSACEVRSWNYPAKTPMDWNCQDFA